MTAQSPQPKEPALDKIPVKLTQIDLQFIAQQALRKQRLLQTVETQFAESVQHYVVLCAHKRNIQFDDNLFHGIQVDPVKKQAHILLRKQ